MFVLESLTSRVPLVLKAGEKAQPTGGKIRTRTPPRLRTPGIFDMPCPFPMNSTVYTVLTDGRVNLFVIAWHIWLGLAFTFLLNPCNNLYARCADSSKPWSWL